MKPVGTNESPRIATLTLNPAIDVAYAVAKLFHTDKMRTHGEHYTPGGGGINVARVFQRLGGSAQAFYLAGGATGSTLDGLLDGEGIARARIPIEGNTRVCMTVFEDETGKEYRFVPPGPTVGRTELRDCLDQLSLAQGQYLVASGSLPPGAPDDFYAQVAKVAAACGMRFVFDSSGEGLRGGLQGGGVHLVKPSLDELRRFTGSALSSKDEIADAAMAMVTAGQAELVAVTLGRDGALLAAQGGVRFLPAVPVKTRSAVGAGDSFLAGMVHGLASGEAPFSAFRIGMAAGAAAVLSPGGGLCDVADVTRLLNQVSTG